MSAGLLYCLADDVDVSRFVAVRLKWLRSPSTLLTVVLFRSKSSSQVSTLSSPPTLAPLRDEFHIPEFMGGLRNLKQLNLWVIKISS